MFAKKIIKLSVIFILSCLNANDTNIDNNESININSKIIIPFDSIQKSIEIQRYQYAKDLVLYPYFNKAYYDIWKKSSNKEIRLHGLIKAFNNKGDFISYLRGLVLFIEKDYIKALPFFRKSANLGNPDALFFYSLYYTPYIGNSTDIKRFYILFLQSLTGESSVLKDSIIRWWGKQDIKPLIKAKFLVNFFNKSIITQSALKNIDEYFLIFRDPKIDIVKSAHLTLLFKQAFYAQKLLAPINNQPVLKNIESSTLATLNTNEKNCTKGQNNIIYTNMYKPENSCGRNVSFKEFIKKVRPGDICLITNKTVHHFLYIYSINYKEKKVRFLDGWPKESFLLQNNNILGLRGKIVQAPLGDLIELSFEDFKYVIVGCRSIM